MSPTAVANALLGSPERYADLAAADFQELLHRQVDPAGLSTLRASRRSWVASSWSRSRNARCPSRAPGRPGRCCEQAAEAARFAAVRAGRLGERVFDVEA
jgi:hypothetical protein